MTQTNEGPRKVIRVTVERPGRKALVAEWGGISLKWQVNAVLDDQPAPVWNVGTDLLQRLLADTCELCGSHDQIEVHHVKALRDLQPTGMVPSPSGSRSWLLVGARPWSSAAHATRQYNTDCLESAWKRFRHWRAG